jgi:MFS family permease
MQAVAFRSVTVTIVALVSLLTGLYFYLPVMTLYMQYKGLSLVEINLLNALLLGSQFVAEVPTGLLADRLGRKRSWIIGLVLQFLGELLFLFASSFWVFALIQMIAGFGFAFMSGCVEALVYESLPRERRNAAMKRALGLISAAVRFANLLAFSLGGWLVRDLKSQSYSFAILLTVISVGLGLLVGCFVRDVPAQAHDGAPPSALQLFRDGVKLLQSNKGLRRLVLLGVLSDPFGFYLVALYQPYFVRADVPGQWFGYALALGSLLAMLCDRYGYLLEEGLGLRRGMLLGTALPGIFYLVMAFQFQPVVAIVLFIVQYGSMNAIRPTLRAYINDHVPDAQRTTTLSLIQLLSTVYLAAMGVVWGLLADWSLTWMFVAMGALVLLAALALRVDEQDVTTQLSSEA